MPDPEERPPYQLVLTRRHLALIPCFYCVSHRAFPSTGVTKSCDLYSEAPHLFDSVHPTVVGDLRVHFVDLISSLQGKVKVNKGEAE